MIKTVGAEKGIIVIEDNKEDAVKLMEEKTGERSIRLRLYT